MGAGLPDYVIVNLESLAEKYSAGETVTLDSLKEKNLVNASGRERNLGLKVLGEGELPFALTVKAEVFSRTAQEKIAAAGGAVELVPVKAKWTRKAHEYRLRQAAKAAGGTGTIAAAKADKVKKAKK